MKKKKFRFSKLHKIIAFVLAIVLLCSGVTALFGAINTEALPDEDIAITYKDYVAKNTIEDETEFIGTYLISIKAMNEELYDKAIQSQQDYGQYNFYYKNEMQNGEWFDISSAAGISSLTGADGKRLKEEDLNDLLITCVVGSDGTMKGAKTGEKMGLYDYPNPYDVSGLPEFTNIKSYSEQFYSKAKYEKSEDRSSAEYIYKVMQDFWVTDLKSDITKKADAQLASLQPVYEAMVAAKREEEAEILSSLMKKIDNTRRAEVYYLLGERDFHCELAGDTEPPMARAELLKNELNGDFYQYYYFDNGKNAKSFLSDVLNVNEQQEEKPAFPLKQYRQNKFDGISAKGETTKKKKSEDKEKKDSEGEDSEKKDSSESSESEEEVEEDPLVQFVKDSDLAGLVDTAIAECASAYLTYSSDVLSDPETVLGTAEYNYSLNVINAAEGGIDAVGNDLGMLQTIYNIKDNKIKNNDAELNIINGSLMGQAEGKYSAKVSMGASSEYEAAHRQSKSSTAGDDILEAQNGEIESVRSELEFLISAKNMRLAPKEALDNTLNEINVTDALYAKVPSDGLKSYATESLDAHMEWLNNELARIKSLDDSLVSDMDKLQEQKNQLLDDQLDALYDDDMNLSKRIDAKIDAIDEAIEAEEQKQNAILNDPNATAAEKAAASAALGDTGSNAANQAGDGDDDLASLSAGDGSDSGNGSGSGDGKGSGDGSDSGDGKGSGSDDGSGDGDSAGAGDDAGAGDAAGAGDGAGTGDAAGAGADDSGKDGSDASGNGNAGKKDGLSKDAAQMSEDDILALLEALLGGEFSTLSDSDKAAALHAVDRFGNDGNSAAAKLAKGMLNTMNMENNPFLYLSDYKPGDGLFVSLQTIGKKEVSPYRYGFNATRHEGTMIYKARAVTFTYGSKDVIINNVSKEKMKFVAHFTNNSVYIPYTAAKQYFNVNGRKIYCNQEKALALTDSILSKSNEIYKALAGE